MQPYRNFPRADSCVRFSSCVKNVQLFDKNSKLEVENKKLKEELKKQKIHSINKDANKPSSKRPEWDKKGVGNDGKEFRFGRRLKFSDNSCQIFPESTTSSIFCKIQRSHLEKNRAEIGISDG